MLTGFLDWYNFCFLYVIRTVAYGFGTVDRWTDPINHISTSTDPFDYSFLQFVRPLDRSLRRCFLTVAFWYWSCFLDRYNSLLDCAPSIFFIDVWTTGLLSPFHGNDTFVFLDCPYPFSFIHPLHAVSITLTIGCTFSAGDDIHYSRPPLHHTYGVTGSGRRRWITTHNMHDEE